MQKSDEFDNVDEGKEEFGDVHFLGRGFLVGDFGWKCGMFQIADLLLRFEQHLKDGRKP